MPCHETKMETMIFNYQTTYRSDFRHGEIVPHTPTLYKVKPKCLYTNPPLLKDLHTLTAWRNKQPVPFSLMHKPRPFIDTNPNNVPATFVKVKDEDKEHVIKTRPRLVMPPAISMDDIEDKRVREILCDSMYTTDAGKASKEALREYFTVKAPMPPLPSPANPITLPPLEFPYVSPEWRMETLSFDRKQLRGHCDPTKNFWLNRKLSPCKSCKETEIMHEHRKRVCQTKLDGRT